MEITEQEDNFQLWHDTIKDHHPDIILDSNLIMLIRDSFMAGYWAASSGIDFKELVDYYVPQTH